MPELKMCDSNSVNMKIEQVYTSVACNRTPEIVDWNTEGIICYGAANAVIIYDTNIRGKDPLTVLAHHKSQVNSVKWLRQPDGRCTELLSCSADKSAAIWTLNDGVWKVTSALTGHGDGVTCVYGLYVKENDLIVYTGSIDSTVRVWERLHGVTNLKQTISLHSGICLTLHACIMPIANQPVLFCALDDHKIHIFSEDVEYHRVHTLAGHEDWVRGLDTITVEGNTLMLASASQDTYIRLWRIQKNVNIPTREIKVEQKVFLAHGVEWSVKLDSVLAGHEGWVYGVQWQELLAAGSTQPSYRILSSSLDKTIIIWEPENQGGAWVERVRVGDVGGNGLGFYGSRFGPGSFMGHGYNGSLHVWKFDEIERWTISPPGVKQYLLSLNSRYVSMPPPILEGKDKSNQCHPCVVVGGHFSGVEDVSWAGGYLLSAARDQTTRLHAPWRTGAGEEWHELGRPQVHGYDLACVAPVSPTTFAAAAEEKVIRVFAAPHNFLANYANIVGEELRGADLTGPEGAAVPSLGLSNKAVFGAEPADAQEGGYFVPVDLHEPPPEETLQQNTLWPEVHKAYGHGYELQCLAASADGALLASACRASGPEHAAPLLWETAGWQQLQRLPFHQLTVTQLAFAPDSRRLLSVSRDRRWALHARAQGSALFCLVANSDKPTGVHTRIIWCCAWARDGAVFGTGSRDGKVCVWTKSDIPSETSLKEYGLSGKPLEVQNASVTALDFAPVGAAARVVAVGFESGLIRLYSFDGTWTLLKELDHSAAHHLTVKRLAFRPELTGAESAGAEPAGAKPAGVTPAGAKPAGAKSNAVVLASGGADHLVRIYRILL